MSSALNRKLQQAEQRLRRGDADGARALVQQVLERAPRNPDAWFLYAMSRLAQGSANEAAAAFERVLGVEPQHGPALEHLGLALLMSGRYDEAAHALARAAAIPGAPASVHMRLGLALLEQGRVGDALPPLERAAAMDGRDPDVQLNLGRALAAAGDDAAAERAFDLVQSLAPERPEAPFNLGLIALNRGALERAQQCFERALALEPRNAELLGELARALALQGRLDAARERWLAAAALAPDRPDTHEGLASCAIALGRFGEAIQHLRAALQLAPARDEARALLALALFETGDLDTAAEEARRVIAGAAPSATAHSTLANIHLVRGQLEDAITVLEQGYRRTADTTLLGTLVYQLRQACDWERWSTAWAAMQPLLETSDALGSPFWLLCEPTTAEQQLTYTRRWAAARFRGIAIMPPEPGAIARAGRRLRIGYLSSDLQEHAVACLIADVFDHHDRNRFEIFAYSHGPDDRSAMRQRLRGVEHFVDIAREPDDVAAARIRADQLDVLVDLKGYTLGDRLTIMARRPCAIQMTWLGYPGTTGAPFVDYLIADPIIVPREAEAYYSERIVRMPHTYQPTDRKRSIDPSRPRSAYGLPEDGFVFCCFNQPNKISPEVFAVWMRLLDRVPGSVLWLLDYQVLATTNLRRSATSHQVDPARLVFGPKMPNPAHLARYRAADLSLDAFPYTSHTTLSDALWCGCPGIALCGETFASRVSTSLLQAAGLPDLVTHNLADYEALAYALASEPAKHREIRERVAAARDTSPLFDSATFARNLEDLYASLLASHDRERGESR